jgi:thiosulfate/3-mercaptopyruvate sulfurtransferase
LTREVPSITATTYSAKEPNDIIRAFRDDVQATIGNTNTSLVDVRSPAEYSGEKLHMEGYDQEGAQRAGHVPGAKSIPWAPAANADGTFKSADELNEIYGGKGVSADKPVIAYCRIGERSAHTWFVLTELLGHPNVRNYDGSWTEWGNLVGAPIER